MNKLTHFIKSYGWMHKVLSESEDLGLLLELFPDEHQAKLQDSEKYDMYRCTRGGRIFREIMVERNIGIIWGHPKGQPPKRWIPQALRFSIAEWTAVKAKQWLEENRIKYMSFKPAVKIIKELTIKLGQHPEFQKIRELKRLKRKAERVKNASQQRTVEA